MRKIIWITFAVMLSLSLALSAAAHNDVSEVHWAHKEIAKCCEEGLFEGYSDGNFKPNATITRAEAIKVLVSYSDREVSKNASEKYLDIATDKWYAPYIEAGKDLLSPLWVSANAIKPDVAITREEAVYAIVNATGYKTLSSDVSVLSGFSDEDSISKELAESFAIAVENELIRGYQDGCVRPKATLTRAEFAAIMCRAVYNEEILSQRRAAAEKYMREMATVLWRPKEDILYTISSNTTPSEATQSNQLLLRADRIYSGIPYGYGGSTATSFLDYSAEKDENGVYVISGLPWQALSGVSTSSRIGNDCSSALVLAWGSVGATFTTETTQTVYMTDAYGFEKVGNYSVTAADTVKYKDTRKTILENGEKVIFAAYAELKPADGVVRATTSGNHAMMVVGVDVVYDARGEIDENKSVVTLVDQTAGNFRAEETYYDEKIGSNVYRIAGVDHQYTFRKLIAAGYVPITCKSLVDSSPVAEPVITDSETEHNKSNLLKGTFGCNWLMDTCTIKVTNTAGEIIQQATAQVRRRNDIYVKFDLQQFVTEAPEVVRGKINVLELPKGELHCTVTFRLVTGQEITVRDFDFMA
ncbi:MAG: S-layer homology domain-containing protein [Ruminococcaceae bacterium]|nr:S-layer homology domain-containing protein [Oscillospiraceae bacterium]